MGRLLPLSKKLAVSTLAALSLLVSNSVKAQVHGDYNGFKWFIQPIKPDAPSHVIRIVDYDGAGGDITIPTTISTKIVPSDPAPIDLPVTVIGGGAFANKLDITHANIPGSITNIGPSAFQGCSNLKGVAIPNSITVIDESVFADCISLSSISIPGSVDDIRVNAFYDCPSITSVTIPSSVTNMENGSFSSCSNLTKVCFEGNAPTDGGNVFAEDPVSTVYYIQGTTGWGSAFSGVPTEACNQCVGIITDPTPTGTASEPTNTPTINTNKSLVMVIHGWTPGSSTPYSDILGMPALMNAIQARLNIDGTASQWDVQFKDWSKNSGGYPTDAVRNAARIGESVGPQIASAGYQKVLLISHSAGAWVANAIAKDVDAAGVPVSVTFLDAYVPSSETLINSKYLADSVYTSDKLGTPSMRYVEQYFANEPLEGTGLANILPNAVNYNISAMEWCTGDFVFLDPHGWPIRWYMQTAGNPNWEYGHGVGYQNAFAVPPTKGWEVPLSCDVPAESSVMMQSQTTASVKRTSIVGRTTPNDDVIAMIMPPEPALIPSARLKLRPSLTSSSNLQQNGSASTQATSEARPNSTFSFSAQASGTELGLTDTGVLAQGGSGIISTNIDGVELATTNFIWETFSLNITNGITVGGLDYTLSNQCNSVVGMWMDGKPLQIIQSATNDELSSFELFPLSAALGAGNHLLTVSLESLDGSPIAATLKGVGFYYVVSPPRINTPTVSQDGTLTFSWESGAGLKYQPQSNNDLTSTNWNNLGGLQTSPTNAIMSAFDSVYANRQKFYRVMLVQ